MGVRTPDGADAPVEVIRHGKLFARRLGMKVEQRKGRLFIVFEQLVRRFEGIVRVESKVAAADQIHHCDARSAAVENAVAPSRHTRAEILRAQNVRAVVKIIRDLHLAEAVVAERDNVSPRGEDTLGVVRRQADHRGVFPIDHGEVDILQFFHSAQMALKVTDAAAAHHIADGQNIVEHGVPPLLFSSV